MVFLHITDADEDKNKIEKLRQYYNSNVNIFMLIYMNGCEPCNIIKPEWAKLENVLNKYNSDDKVAVIDIENDIFKTAKLNGFDEPSGFPTIVHLYNKKREDYENSSMLKEDEKDRKIDSLVKWIKNTLIKPEEKKNVINETTDNKNNEIKNNKNNDTKDNDTKDNEKNNENNIDTESDIINTNIGGKRRKTNKKNKSNKKNKTNKKTKKQKGGKWSRKYKRSINCKKPKGFSQRQYCKYGRKK